MTPTASRGDAIDDSVASPRLVGSSAELGLGRIDQVEHAPRGAYETLAMSSMKSVFHLVDADGVIDRERTHPADLHTCMARDGSSQSLPRDEDALPRPLGRSESASVRGLEKVAEIEADLFVEQAAVATKMPSGREREAEAVVRYPR